jgi:signal transduction histidine kinase
MDVAQHTLNSVTGLPTPRPVGVAADIGPESATPSVALKTILVVDDELGPREALKFILTPAYNVIAATDGREALALFETVMPDMVISDIRMPGMSGLELMKEVRQEWPDTPFVLLTGYGTLESAQEAVRHGAFDYISKPYNIHEIRRVVTKAIEDAERKREGRKQFKRLQAMNALLKEQVRELEQRASLGVLSAEMVHDLNNPITVLRGYVSLLEDSLSREMQGGGSESHEFVDVIKDQIERCVSLTRRFLDFARNSQQAWDREDVNDILQDTLFVLRGRMRALNVRLETDLAVGLPKIWVQPTPLQQVFHNLVANALDALEERGTGGRLWVTSHRVNDDAEGAEPVIQVFVRDNGPGIPPEVSEKVFAPFFSTKPKGKGTGLGLSICRRILDEHGGAIAMQSDLGRGCCFTVTLPVRLEKPATPAAAAAPTASSH